MKPGPQRFSELFYNVVTYIGVMISLLVATIEVFLFALDYFSKGKNLYLGLITYLILPAFLILGLVLIPAGVFWKRMRIRHGLPTFELRRFRIDLALPHHRNALLVFIVGTALLMLMSLVGAYKAFHYTESVQFCGALCHEIMQPEYTAYQHSPHGKVKCVECHIGEGADWYVQSKMSGTRQVVRTLTDTYKLPIDTPVHNLRPAEETCKQCHWPGKYFGTLDFNRTYFLTEGEDPRWKIRMLLNVGSGKDQSAGVHAHMNVDQDIYYAAEDERRQKITWVKSVDKLGRSTVYVSPESKWKGSAPPAGAVRKMDCIDCHNRPTHRFIAPYRLVNDAMQYGHVDYAALPGYKQKALELLSADYKTAPEALAAIEEGLSKAYPEGGPAVGQAIQVTQKLFKTNLFPEMKARWDTHPDNIGHLVAPGCFRCHDERHRSAEGRVISKDCRSCHVIVEQGPPAALEKNIDGLDFRHPDGGEDWKEMDCFDCHTGGGP
ncbi:MAG: hypothetical protein A3D28_06075 [Omnitrophica bacterium RIFCSPHIGHO2_02_FULL_63_14]|nr:MAG: hypothetical protein A3D28_06075 [Omnitrophica bacterium RIFCSPHIGHO2_02_FULL_63_14]